MSRKQLRRLETEICRIHNLFVDDEGEWLGGIAIASNLAEIRQVLTEAMRVRSEVMELYRKLELLQGEVDRLDQDRAQACSFKAASLAHSQCCEAHRAVSAYREAHDL